MSFVGKQLMGKVQQLNTMFPSTSKAFNQDYTFISTVVVLALILIIVTIYTTRQMLAASWGEPEACQHPMVLFCAIDYS